LNAKRREIREKLRQASLGFIRHWAAPCAACRREDDALPRSA
jgi:hypothetical protein